MTTLSNHQVLLADRPIGLPKNSDWNIIETDTPELKTGEILVKNKFISVDPAMRGWMNDRATYVPPIPLNSVMRALTVGEVVQSNSPSFSKGDEVAGLGGVQSFCASDAKTWEKVDTSISPLPMWLDTLGIAGLTAYCGLLEVGQPKPGDTVLVSGAAGSVGSHVGQIAKIKGCRVVGIAGGSEKCKHIVDVLPFDDAIDYKTAPLRDGLKRTCANGVDVFFDNVGGETLNLALGRINVGARVVIFGAISQYNVTEVPTGPAAYINLLGRRSRMEGFIYFDFKDKWPAMQKDLASWHSSGKIQTQHDIARGDVSIFPQTLLRLFEGDNFGKLMIELSH